MKVGAKKTEFPLDIGVARAANEGLSRQELLQKTLHTLSSDSRADRIGAWLESPEVDAAENNGVPSFRGMVWDRQDENSPPEWRRLSPEAPLPQAMLTAGLSVEQELERGSLPMIGPLLELRRAIWVPVERRGRLRGVLLAGSRSRHGDMSRTLFESVAAELALAIELEEEQQSARERQADLGMVKQMMAGLSGSRSGHVLLDIADNCTSSSQYGNGLDATFAAIGEIADGQEIDATFRWQSGDGASISAIATPPVCGLWQSAIETHRVMGAEPDAGLARDGVGRIIAVPMEAGGKMVGVLVVGLIPRASSLVVIERLELRAALATLALESWKRNERELLEAAARKSVLDSSAEAIVLLDARGEIVEFSAAARTLLGEQPSNENEAQTGGAARRLKDLFLTVDQPRIDAWSGRALLGANERRGERRNGPSELPEAILSNGIKVRLRPAIPAGGPHSAVVLEACEDPDDPSNDSRAHAELHSVLEWLDEGVILFDAQENVRAINTRFLHLTGLNSSSAVELSTLEGLIFNLSPCVAEPWNFAQRWRNLARGIDGGIREELELIRPAPRILQRVARPMLDALGQRLGRVEIYRDLTARRGFQSKLLHTEKLAAFGQLVTGVVHELNNPLTSILGYSQRLLQTEQTAGNGREIRQIFQEAERATAILRQLLLNAHENKPELSTVAINQVVLQTIELQQVSLAQENIGVELDLDPGWPMVHGDAGHLQQVLLNLTGNARQALDHTGKGGTVRVRTKQIDDHRVLLEIADNGPGIPSEILGRIFDPFFTTKPAGTGTGLGLAIVLGIVREHGGHVNVASPPGGGAIFSIALRAAGASRSAIPATAGKLPSYQAYLAGAAARQNSTLAADIATNCVAQTSATPVVQDISQSVSNRILVVEDEPTVARLIADVLEDEGFHVDVLLDGQEALQQAARESYDLVICDMKMPGLDGRQFYKALLQAGNSLSDRFLFVTGDVVSINTHEFLARYRLPHVAKPFRMEELKDCVRGLLDRCSRHRPRVTQTSKNDEVRPK
jgi:signal transduction histidine kinase/CheY-like chemotaxis protein